MEGIEKCKQCRCGYVASHFSCMKENEGLCDRHTNYGFEPKKDSMNCDRMVEQIEKLMMYRGEAPEEGRLREILEGKPKQHPLDELVVEGLQILKLKDQRQGVWMKDLLKKLRYEAFHEGCDKSSAKWSREETNEVLKIHKLEEWIV